MKKEKIGYAAFDKESGKGLACSYGITNRLSLTEDPEKLCLLPTAKEAEDHTIWFNHSHKNQKEFEIRKVAVVTEVLVIYNQED